MFMFSGYIFRVLFRPLSLCAITFPMLSLHHLSLC